MFYIGIAALFTPVAKDITCLGCVTAELIQETAEMQMIRRLLSAAVHATLSCLLTDYCHGLA